MQTMRNAIRKGSKHYEGKDVQRPPEPGGDVLPGGQAAAARLRTLNRAKWPTTLRLLSGPASESSPRSYPDTAAGEDVAR